MMMFSIFDDKISTRYNKDHLIWPVISVVIGYTCLKAIGQIKVGLRRKLGQDYYDENNNNSGGNNNKRRLGLLERWYVAHSRAGMHTGFFLCMEINNSIPPTIQELRQRILLVSKQFRWLRCKVRRDNIIGIDSRDKLTKYTQNTISNNDPVWGDDLYVQIMDNDNEEQYLPYIRKVEINDNNKLESIIEEESIKEWHDEDPNKPMWRVTLVNYYNNNNNTFALILSFHHLIIDGISSLHVANAIINPDNAKFNNNNVVTMNNSNSNNNNTLLPPPMEDVIDTNPNIRHILVPVLLDRFPILTKFLQPLHHWKGNPVHVPVKNGRDRTTQLICIPLIDSMNDMNTLNECAKCHSISVSSILVATLCTAIAITQCANNKTTKTHFKIQVPINERKKRCISTVSTIELGCYITGPQIILTLNSNNNNNNVCKLSRTFTKKLKQSIQSSTMDIGLCKFIQDDWIEFATKYSQTEPNGIHDSIETSIIEDSNSLLSNKNNNDSSDDIINNKDCWNVKRTWFGQGRRGFSAAVMVHIFITNHKVGQINVCMASFPDALSKESMHQIAKQWKNEIDKLLK